MWLGDGAASRSLTGHSQMQKARRGSRKKDGDEAVRERRGFKKKRSEKIAASAQQKARLGLAPSRAS
jgi:hypothetical protein